MVFLRQLQIHTNFVFFNNYLLPELCPSCHLRGWRFPWQLCNPAVLSHSPHLLLKSHWKDGQKYFAHSVPQNWLGWGFNEADLWHWWNKVFSLYIILYSFINSHRIWRSFIRHCTLGSSLSLGPHFRMFFFPLGRIINPSVSWWMGFLWISVTFQLIVSSSLITVFIHLSPCTTKFKKVAYLLSFNCIKAYCKTCSSGIFFVINILLRCIWNQVWTNLPVYNSVEFSQVILSHLQS